MHTAGLLGITEQLRRHFDAAEKWYDGAQELATRRGDPAQLAATAQNRSILYQQRAQELADEPGPADRPAEEGGGLHRSLAGLLA